MARTRESQESSELESAKHQLEIHQKNLRKLEEQAALYGPLDVPLKLPNSIELEKKEIARLEMKIAELERPKSPPVKKTVPGERSVRVEVQGRKRGCLIWWGSLSDGTKAAYIGLIGTVIAAIMGLTWRPWRSIYHRACEIAFCADSHLYSYLHTYTNQYANSHSNSDRYAHANQHTGPTNAGGDIQPWQSHHHHLPGQRPGPDRATVQRQDDRR